MSPRRRFESLPAARRRAILRAAAVEFAERGFDAASYNAIIRASGVSKGAMYYYFDDKRDLYLTTLHDAEKRASEAIGSLGPFDDAHSYWEALRDFYLRIMRFFAGEPVLAGLIKSAYAGGPVPDAAYGEFIELASKRFEKLLSDGVAVGAVRDDVPLDLLLGVTMASAEATDRWALRNLDQLIELGAGAVAGVAERLLEFHLRLAAPLALLMEREHENHARRKS